MRPKIKYTISLIILLFAVYSCQKQKTVSLKETFAEVLAELDSALVSFQNTDSLNPDFGGIWCNHCSLYHTRAAEAVFPFAFEYTLTQDKKYLDAAIQLGNWLIRQQFPDGSWKETPEEWTGTSTDQLLMMAQAFKIVKPYLTTEEQSGWENSLKNAGDYLVNVMSPEFASINYVATTTASLMVLNRVIPDEKYEQKAKELALKVVAKMDLDNFITGEGGRVFDAKYGVDLGYNMEMSLWGLALYSKLSGDTLVLNKVIKSAKRHLHFVYPDGSLDGSWGIRSNKWTCYGGATSDGMQVLFSLLDEQDKRFKTASYRNLVFLKSCIKNGLVGYGPQHWEIMDSDPCIYPTFAKAKNLAMAYSYLENDNTVLPELPSDKTGMEIFPTLNVAVIRTGNFCSTVTAYGYKDPKGEESKYMFRPTGGAISNLWIKDYGYFQASSQTEYHRWEPMHFPDVPNIKSLTPRIEFENERGYFTNLFEFDATSGFQSLKNGFDARFFGEMKNRKQEAGGIGYGFEYVFEDKTVTKKVKLRYHSISDTVKIVEPVINWDETYFEKLNDKTVMISRGNRKIAFEVLSGNSILSLGENSEQYWSPYPALQAYPITLLVLPGKNQIENEIIYRFRILE